MFSKHTESRFLAGLSISLVPSELICLNSMNNCKLNSAASRRWLSYARRCHAVRGFGQWELVPKLATELKAPNRTEDAEQFARQ